MHVAIASMPVRLSGLLQRSTTRWAGSLTKLCASSDRGQRGLGHGGLGRRRAVLAHAGDSPPPSVEIVKARAITSAGHPEEALVVLASIDDTSLDADERALVGLARASALQAAGRSDEYSREIAALASRSATRIWW